MLCRKPQRRPEDDIFDALGEEEKLQLSFAQQLWVAQERSRLRDTESAAGIRRRPGRPKNPTPPRDLQPLTREQMRMHNAIGGAAAGKTDCLMYDHGTTLIFYFF